MAKRAWMPNDTAIGWQLGQEAQRRAEKETHRFESLFLYFRETKGERQAEANPSATAYNRMGEALPWVAPCEIPGLYSLPPFRVRWSIPYSPGSLLRRQPGGDLPERLTACQMSQAQAGAGKGEAKTKKAAFHRGK